MKRTVPTAGRRLDKSRLGGEELNDFGQRVRQLREKRGLTQEELAGAVGVTLGLVGRYERGEHLPTADKLLSLSRALHASADFLLRGEQNGADEKMPFKSARLFERFRVIDDLPKDAQKTVFRLLDAVIGNYEFEHLAERRKKLKAAG